jgi:hypothetical protein
MDTSPLVSSKPSFAGGFGGLVADSSDIGGDSESEEVDVWAIAPLASDGAPLTPSASGQPRNAFGFDGEAGGDTEGGGGSGEGGATVPAQLDVFGKAIKAPVVTDYSKRSGWKSTIAFNRGDHWDPEDRRRASQVIEPTDKAALKARLRMLQELAQIEDANHIETAAAVAATGADADLGGPHGELGDVLCSGDEVQPLGVGLLSSASGDDISLASPRSMPTLTSKQRPSTAVRKRAADASHIVDEDLDASAFVVAGDVLFLEPLDWMGEMSGQMGHLCCPCCDAMLGFYDWAGALVGSKTKVSPAFCVYTQSVWVQRPPAVATEQTLAPNRSPSAVLMHSTSMPQGAANPPRMLALTTKARIPPLATAASLQ